MELKRKITSLLQKLNFSELEIAFYFEVLKNPESSIYEISRKLGISKNKAYNIYAILEQRAVVSSSSEGWQKKVVPTALKGLAEQAKRESRSLGKIANDLNEVNKFIPLLDERSNALKIEQLSEEQSKEIYTDVLDEDFDYLLAYGPYEEFVGSIGHENEMSFISKRMRNGKYAKAALIGRGKYTDYLLENDDDQMRKCNVLENESMQKEMKDLFVYMFPQTNKTVVWSRNSEGNLEATVIESPQLVKAHEVTFNHLWRQNSN